MRLALSILLLTCFIIKAEIIPSTNIIAWSNYTGVEGGIPYRIPASAPLATSINAAQLQTALDACPSNGVVQLTNGTYSLGGTFEMPSYVTLRGCGSNTFVKITGTILYRKPGYGYVNLNVASGSTKGSTNIILASAPTDLFPRGVAVINELNNPSWISSVSYQSEVPQYEDTESNNCYPDVGTRLLGQYFTIRSVAGTSITFYPPLWDDYSVDRTARILYAAMDEGGDNACQYAGIENLTLTNTTAASETVWIYDAANCWFSNVWFHIAGYGAQCNALHGTQTYRVTVDHCYFRGWGNGSFCIIPHATCGNWLIVNNIFVNVQDSILFTGRTGGHATLYNYTSSVTNIYTTQSMFEVGTHGAQVNFWLLEGNNFTTFLADATHGGAGSRMIHLRNVWRGPDFFRTYGLGCVWFDYTNRWSAVVGCILGMPGISNAFHTLTFSNDHESVGGDVESPGSDYFINYRWGHCNYNQHTVDSLCRSTTTVHGNYDYFRMSNHWDSGIADHAIPNSYFYGSKPGWFGFLKWPPISNDDPTYSISITNIPAGWRYTFGDDPPLEGNTAGSRLRVTTGRVGVVKGI